jgi:uracil phosphoribosyltransferase
VIILSDPILATGNSVVKALSELESCGIPSHTHIVTVICSEESIENIKRNFSRRNYTLWTVAIDDELTAQAYLVPGLGDAGDLAFGNKQ